MNAIDNNWKASPEARSATRELKAIIKAIRDAGGEFAEYHAGIIEDEFSEIVPRSATPLVQEVQTDFVFANVTCPLCDHKVPPITSHANFGGGGDVSCGACNQRVWFVPSRSTMLTRICA